jgi:exosome complex exonuclease DIS3/RRP44
MSLTDFGQPKDLTASASLLFPPHLSNEELRSGMKAGRYFRGVIRVKGNDRNECYVILMNFSGKDRKTVTVRGENHVNRAVDGDIVAVELLPDTPAEKERNTEYLEEEGIEEDAVAPLLGRVVGIIQHTSEQYAGSIDPGSLQSVSSHSAGEDDTEYYTARFIPMNKRIPPIVVSSRRLPSLLAYRLLAVIDEWPASSVLPFGHCLKVLGAKGDKEVETKLILFEFGVPNEEFTAEVMACLPEKGWTIPQEEIDKRLDCRALPIASVDPPGCKDIDDALHCMALPNGHFQVGVHIADVSHFVLPDTPLDLEASHRSTSTYLVERRLDMLPSLLTTQLCSLRGQEDHLAFSVFWELDADGQIFDVSFHKTVIRSVASLTYDQAQTILDDKQVPDDPVLNQPALVQSIKMLNQFARLLRKRRLENGALTLVSPEVRFKLDEETKDPTDVIMYNLKEAHAMVEEWMLLANITVAKKTLLHFPTLSILRRHQSPSLEQLQPLIQAARHAGFQLEVTNSKALADSLDRAVKADDAYFNSLLRILATRCMMPAQYFCSGEIPKDAWYHYGLATPVYTHFTSPIRRYADVLVHRLLAAAIGVAPLPLANTDRGKQREVCAHMNRRHRLAQYAQRSSVALHTTIFFAQRSVTEDAYVIAIREEECDVLVPKFGIEESLPYSSVAAGFSADLQSYAVRFPGGRSLTIFQRIRVTISVREETNEKKLVLALAQ